MKKMISILMTTILLLGTVCCFTSCNPTSDIDRVNNESFYDGDFKYYYDKKEDFYAIVGDREDENPEVMYIPPYYNGKEVKYVYYSATAILGPKQEYFGPSLKNVKKVYFPFNRLDSLYEYNDYCEYRRHSQINLPQEVYLINIKTYRSFVFIFKDFFKSTERNIFITNISFQLLIKEPYKGNDGSTIEINSYKLLYILNEDMEQNYFIQIANTSYMFNYDNAPNDGYFFINDFERGGKIENTPYEPIRNGYTFDGWYKNSECTNKWNFDTDILPTAEYDENGDVTEFIETKLFAKWIKK